MAHGRFETTTTVPTCCFLFRGSPLQKCCLDYVVAIGAGVVFFSLNKGLVQKEDTPQVYTRHTYSSVFIVRNRGAGTGWIFLTWEKAKEGYSALMSA